MSQEQKPEEEYPIFKDPKIVVLKGTTIYKNKKWWYAVLLTEEWGHKKVKIYMWQFNEKEQKWKRKQHIGINFQKNWEDIRKIVDEYIKEVT